jgi:maleylpyruvate isomerase
MTGPLTDPPPGEADLTAGADPAAGPPLFGVAPVVPPSPGRAGPSSSPAAVAAAPAGLNACGIAHRQLLQRLGGLDETTARRPSLLPGWTVAHVVTHLARNAEGIARWVDGALAGVSVARYPGGREQRDYDIQVGSTRPAPELLDDLWRSCSHLEQVWARAALAGWPDATPAPADAPWPTAESPWRRLVEVEIHHADLGLGYHAGEWSDALVDWMLPLRLQRLDSQVSDSGARRRLLTWLVGRADEPGIGRLEF